MQNSSSSNLAGLHPFQQFAVKDGDQRIRKSKHHLKLSQLLPRWHTLLTPTRRDVLLEGSNLAAHELAQLKAYQCGKCYRTLLRQGFGIAVGLDAGVVVGVDFWALSLACSASILCRRARRYAWAPSRSASAMACICLGICCACATQVSSTLCSPANVLLS